MQNIQKLDSKGKTILKAKECFFCKSNIEVNADAYQEGLDVCTATIQKIM